MAADLHAGFIALNRFGLGSRRGGDLAAAASDPRGFLRAELEQPGIAALEAPDLPRTAVALKILFTDQEQQRLQRLAADMTIQTASLEESPGTAGTPSSAKPKEAPKPPPPAIQQVFRTEASARLRRILEAQPGFVERLVQFWTNHFCVATMKGGFVRIAAGAFERDAIRPHVLGRFGDMLQAVESHPAMLFYLDNQLSIGPNSPAGQRTGRGLNENLAREILELHTLGVNGGYTQADVTALARIITGWTFAGRAGQLGEPGSFVFNANSHEPGEQIVLGRPYAQRDVGQGREALADIARHPATAQHLAFKLARHFVADEPPPALVAKLTDIFRNTDGALKALAVALVDRTLGMHRARRCAIPKNVSTRRDGLSGACPKIPANSSARCFSRHAALGPAWTERFSRYCRRLGEPRRHESAARNLRTHRRSLARFAEPARSSRRDCRRSRIERNTPGDCARRIEAAGVGFVVDVPGSAAPMKGARR